MGDTGRPLELWLGLCERGSRTGGHWWRPSWRGCEGSGERAGDAGVSSFEKVIGGVGGVSGLAGMLLEYWVTGVVAEGCPGPRYEVLG
jgi:hypothetical protein